MRFVRSEHAKNVAPDFDWTYSTDYKGNVLPGQAEGVQVGVPGDTDQTIDLERLRVQEPILFFDEVVLFEDELADNGTAFFNVKLRVMPSGFYCLARFFLRVDDVLLRARDTRVYHAFNTNFVLREHSLRESSYHDLEMAGKMPKDVGQLGVADAMIPLLNLRSAHTDKMELPIQH